MVDRESVMQALKDSLRNQHCGFIENVGNVYAVSEETINDVLELLKELDAVKIKVNKINGRGRCGRCPSCGNELNEMDYPYYCGFCGQAVKRNV